MAANNQDFWDNNQDIWNVYDPSCFSCEINGFQGRMIGDENRPSASIIMFQLDRESPTNNPDVDQDKLNQYVSSVINFVLTDMLELENQDLPFLFRISFGGISLNRVLSQI